MGPSFDNLALNGNLIGNLSITVTAKSLSASGRSRARPFRQCERSLLAARRNDGLLQRQPRDADARAEPSTIHGQDRHIPTSMVAGQILNQGTISACARADSSPSAYNSGNRSATRGHSKPRTAGRGRRRSLEQTGTVISEQRHDRTGRKRSPPRTRDDQSNRRNDQRHRHAQQRRRDAQPRRGQGLVEPVTDSGAIVGGTSTPPAGAQWSESAARSTA